jgi:methylthioribose-1-phosphate isomerase
LKIDHINYRTIWCSEDGWSINIIDQNSLPEDFKVIKLSSLEQVISLIKTNIVTGRSVNIALAMYGMALAMKIDSSDESIRSAAEVLTNNYSNNENIKNIISGLSVMIASVPPDIRQSLAYKKAKEMADLDVEINSKIGDNGLSLIINTHNNIRQNRSINLLTHGNAGWLTTVDWGIALSTIYKSHSFGIPINVWVTETIKGERESALTCWELEQQGISHSIIDERATGYMMQNGLVDICLISADLMSAEGDVFNNVGTYVKALAAKDNNIPFYIALPSSSIDWTLYANLSLENTNETDKPDRLEIKNYIKNNSNKSNILTANLLKDNFYSEVTPSSLITGLITEKGYTSASAHGLAALFPDRAPFVSLG